VRAMSIGENYENRYNPLPLRHFEIFAKAHLLPACALNKLAALVPTIRRRDSNHRQNAFDQSWMTVACRPPTGRGGSTRTA